MTQQSPAQGTIPSVPTDQEQLAIIEDRLLDALNSLHFCHTYLESSKLSERYSELFTATSDALNSCNEAIHHTADTPDTYDVALSHLPPINGNIQPPMAAF